MMKQKRPEPEEIEFDEYIRNICPDCGASNTNHYHTSMYEDECVIYWHCYKCRAKWLEKYKLKLVRYQKEMLINMEEF